MTVKDCDREQLVELKQAYLMALEAEGTLNEIVGENCVSLDMFYKADEIVLDDVIFEYYDGVCFVEEDFCSLMM